jgi:CubicO group peptidase (beta-lactamase class C family)
MQHGIAVALTSLLLIPVAPGAGERHGEPDPREPDVPAAVAQVDEQLDKACANLKIAGMSVAVVRDQYVLLAKGYGYADLENKIAADPRTVYRLGSITKVFTATMLMQLRDAGKLQLDDPVEKYLSEFKVKSRFPDARPITFRQVAAHYSGLPTEAPLPYTYRRVTKFPTAEELLASLKGTELAVPPMTEFRYSNLGYNILGLALERVAGQPYAGYVQQHILTPLGMGHTDFTPTDPMRPHLAIGYGPAKKDGSHPAAPYVAYGTASGMLYSSVEDMTEFLKMQFRDGAAGGKQVLGGSSLREMTAPIFVSNSDPLRFWRNGSGVGWQVFAADGEQYSHKSGGTSGFSCEIIVNPRLKLGIALFTNTECTPFYAALAALRKLTPAVKRDVAQQAAELTRASLPSLNKYAGDYTFVPAEPGEPPPFKGLHVELSDDGLRVTVSAVAADVLVSVNKVALRAVGKDRFRMMSDTFEDEYIGFDTDRRGNSVRAHWRQYAFDRK